MNTLVIALFWMAQFGIPVSDGYEVGDSATDFKLKGVNGEWVSMENYTDANGFIVIFTCNHCPYSKAYEDRIIEIQNQYEPKGYPVIAINPNDAGSYPSDSYENMQKRAIEKGFNFPYLHDENQEIAATYGALKTPHVYLLDMENDGKLRVAYIGAIDDKPYRPNDVSARFLEDAVNALISGKKPDPNYVKAVGCSIKWKK